MNWRQLLLPGEGGWMLKKSVKTTWIREIGKNPEGSKA
jgi:hypothetical protein